jgi:hypothetical protein
MKKYLWSVEWGNSGMIDWVVTEEYDIVQAVEVFKKNRPNLYEEKRVTEIKFIREVFG